MPIRFSGVFASLLFVPLTAAVGHAGGGMTATIDGLGFRVIDAEYSKELDRIVAVAATPTSQLHIYDPVNQTDLAVNLPLPPSCVSVDPGGTFAVAGHDGWITLVDLLTGTVVQSLPVSTITHDVVLGGNGFAYVFPKTGQWVQMHCIELATGVETLGQGSIRQGTNAELHPNGWAVYGADNGLSPSDIEKYNISPGTSVYLYDSPYHGTYAMCGDLWISDDGLRIFTRCSNVFRSSSIQSEDMTYNGSLGMTSIIEDLDHSSINDKVLVIQEGATLDSKLQIYDYDFLAFDEAVSLPDIQVGPGTFDMHGRFVFIDSTATRAFVVAVADPQSGLLMDYGVATYSFGGPCSGSWSNYCTSKPNSSGSAATIGMSGSLSVALNDTWLSAENCPPNAVGIFVLGLDAAQLPFGDGTLCIDAFGSGIKRPWSPAPTDANGEAVQFVDFPNLPANAQIPGGSTRYFQYWFRDPLGPGGQGFNLSDGATATFCE